MAIVTEKYNAIQYTGSNSADLLEMAQTDISNLVTDWFIFSESGGTLVLRYEDEEGVKSRTFNTDDWLRMGTGNSGVIQIPPTDFDAYYAILEP